jgi:ABC-2 type transport system permease protein
MFNFLSEATNTSMQSILISASLIKKVYIPKYIFPLEKVSFSFVNFAVSMVAVIIVGLIERIGISWHILLVPLLLVVFYFFCLGLGLILSVLAVFFRDTLHIYGIILTAWMYLTPVFYTLDNIGDIFV